MRLFGGDRISKLMDRMNVPEDEAIESGLVTKAIEGAQRKVEVYHFNIRKQVLEYDNVMNKQREIIYAERRKVLEGADMQAHLQQMIKRVMEDLVDRYANAQVNRDEWDYRGLHAAAAEYAPLLGHIDLKEFEDCPSAEALKTFMAEQAIDAYGAKEATMGPEMMRQLERYLMLRIIDTKWIEHLHDIDALRDGIGLRAYGQKDPLREYQREAYDLFQDLLKAIQHDLIKQAFHIQVVYDVPPMAPPMIHNMAAFGPEGLDDSANA